MKFTLIHYCYVIYLFYCKKKFILQQKYSMFISFLWDYQYVNAERCVFRTQPNTYGGDFFAKILAFVSSFTIEKVNRMSIFA